MHCNIVIPLHAFRPLSLHVSHVFQRWPDVPQSSLFGTWRKCRSLDDCMQVSNGFEHPSLPSRRLCTPWRMHHLYGSPPHSQTLTIKSSTRYFDQSRSIKDCIPASVG